jgi:hypothetical protein
MTRGHAFRRCPMVVLALVESLCIRLPLKLNPPLDQHVSS